MKIAVLGPSPEGLHIAQAYFREGASVRLFWGPEITSEKEKDLLEYNCLVPSRYKSVTKRFLVAGETPVGRTRFADLFRVSYEVSPVERVHEAVSEQPEVFDKLTSEFMESLKSQLELFEDFDVVIDASPSTLVRTLGPGGPCVGESRLRVGTLYYLDTLPELKEKLSRHEIAVVGDGSVAAQVLKSLKDWWSAGEGRIFLITNQGRPFEGYLKESPDPELESFLNLAQAEQDLALAQHKEELAQWEELDDFIKAKKAKPAEPIPRLVFFSAHILTAADQLIDKSRTFLTLETTPWSEAQVQVENNQVELKTIGVDFVIGACGRRRDHSRFHGLNLALSVDGKTAGDEKGIHPEVGFFSLQKESQMFSIIDVLSQLFSPKESQQ